IPVPLLAYGYGRIPVDVENTLLLLRLYRPGDLSFVEMRIEKPDRTLAVQSPYGAMGDITSSMFYEFASNDVAAWEPFATELRNTAAWDSTWFKRSRRFFLYGGSKECNVEWDEIDRIVDYMIALEAALVPERLFVGRCLRERSARLIGQDNVDTERFLRDL